MKGYFKHEERKKFFPRAAGRVPSTRDFRVTGVEARAQELPATAIFWKPQLISAPPRRRGESLLIRFIRVHPWSDFFPPIPPCFNGFAFPITAIPRDDGDFGDPP
jgi:hypothetical protein